MSICFNTVNVEDKEEKIKSLNNNFNNSGKVVLKCSGNILKPKCNKALKRKLKKYKLRKDGKEDQEIIDVSQTFITSLTIKSPKNLINTVSSVNLKESVIESKSNQSLKMGRKKKDTVNADSAEINVIDSVKSTESLALCIDKQEKKQMDAFKLLMDSRNKVIGCNSPGKERSLEACNTQEIIAKKEMKAKRILSLQKMAQAKGSLQKQEQEESRETYVKHKMEKRAERLKQMIVKREANFEKKFNNKPDTSKEKSNETQINTELFLGNKFNCPGLAKSILSNSCFPTKSSVNQNVSEEEVKFLEKLSPSLRKKENMLCYFNVVTKDAECCSDKSQSENDRTNNQTIIKVKFTPRSKKKKKTDHATNETPSDTIHRSTSSFYTENTQEITTTKKLENNDICNDRQKRKRKKHINENLHVISVEEISSTGTRPKRNTKKPIKYSDDVSTLSSDEELHIFTPKKKKSSKSTIEQIEADRNENIKERKNHTTEKSIRQYANKTNSEMNISILSVQDKKLSKLAPIFNLKPQLTTEELKAKEKFLHGGIPNHVKKNPNYQINNNSLRFDVFHKVVHIQQIEQKHAEATKPFSLLPLLHSDNDLNLTNVPLYFFKKLLISDTSEDKCVLDIQNNIESLLGTMKKMYSKFPVYRTYHCLKAKSRGEFGDSHYTYLDNSVEIINSITDMDNDNSDKLKWADKYKATSTKQLIGNFDSIKELRKWLISWTENDVVVKNDSDSSNFCYSDTDSGDVIRMKNNLLIITGKTGSGKTSSVYAVASELSIKVIEVNASNKRTGKIMLQALQEATQSHKVDRQRDCTDNSQKSVDRDTNILPMTKKRGKPPKSKSKLFQKATIGKKDTNSEPFSSQESIRTAMSLILIDDADIVFDQDDGFCSAIAQLIHSSKRPVILVTESLQCPHLQKFMKYGQIINLKPFLPRMLGTWLDIVCLADNGTCYPGLGAKILDYFKGDIRKSINYLQYYMTTQKHLCKQASAQGTDFIDKPDIIDESSSMSWAINEDLEKNASIFNTICTISIQYFMGKQLNMHNPSPTLSFNVWWSLPQLLGFDHNNENIPVFKEIQKPVKNKILELETIYSAIDTLSLIDLFEHNIANSLLNITSKPWFSPESASLIETESFDYYDRNNDIRQDISQSLMTSSIEHAQTILNYEHKTDVQFPSMTLQREKDRIVNRHKSLAGYFNPSAVLDRKAVSLDYWPCCRNICRMERRKTDSKSKRNNRFCHYLKSVNVLCKNDYFDKLGDSLCNNDNM